MKAKENKKDNLKSGQIVRRILKLKTQPQSNNSKLEIQRLQQQLDLL